MIEFGARSITIFGFDIYYYAMIITSGIIVAMIVASLILKHKGIKSDIVLDYTIIVMPLAIIGSRLYFLLFPYSTVIDYYTVRYGERAAYDWFINQWEFSHVIDTRGGGLGVYGGVIVGYAVGWILTKVKRLNTTEMADTIMPAVMLAQSVGRWGNFINGEAHGVLITNPNMQWFPFGVYVDGSWYQATFFYESLCTLVGFLICVWLLRRKNYRNGWTVSFYGIYYGIVRLFIEGLRTDSLYLIIPDFINKRMINTNIRISQAISIICICLGVIRLIVLYRKEIILLIKRIFGRKSELNA
ncbi:MAG: prolipoprotein diacylglyceryl transferase [Clostridia bacterium]|nr:prolipoprotein diacylglyceryl transferase [Clostridia bacterium]